MGCKELHSNKFESSVNLERSKTLKSFGNTHRRFESSVNLEGSKISSVPQLITVSFESSVNLERSKTGCCVTELR